MLTMYRCLRYTMLASLDFLRLRSQDWIA